MKLFSGKIFHLSFGLGALALDGILAVATIAFPEWTLVEVGGFMPWLMAGLGLAGVFGIGTCFIAEWRSH